MYGKTYAIKGLTDIQFHIQNIFNFQINYFYNNNNNLRLITN